MATTSPLRQRMIEDMTIRNLSRATQQSYIYAVRKFSRHFGRSPDRLGIEDVRAYQLHLIAQKRSWSHINQTACALRFFYGVTLGRQEAFERIVTGREPEKLPPVLSPEEIARLLEAVAGLRNRVALTTAYAAGLRIGEVCRLKVASIKSKRHEDTLAQRRPAGSYAPRPNRLGIQNWRMASTTVGMSRHASRPKDGVLRPRHCESRTGRPAGSTQWNKIGSSSRCSMAFGFSNRDHASSRSFMMA